MMKKKLTMMALVALVATGAGAQTIYDATQMAQHDLNGTARFVGMGGAMGALGGDISTISTNPAGIGIYRSHDAMVTFGYSTMSTDSRFAGQSMTADKNRFTFDNVGFVLSTKFSNQAPLRYINFGFNYKKAKNFYRNTDMGGLVNLTPNGEVVSQTYQMATQANQMLDEGYDIAQMNDNLFDHNMVGWLAALGWEGYLYNEDFDDKGNFLGYAPFLGQPDARFYSQERGGVDEYDFNVSFNINDRVYLGMTIGAYNVDYRKYAFYDEDYGNGEGYSLENRTDISGGGFDVKLGAIFRPIETSPLRVGLAIHTPTFYRLKLATSAYLVSDVWGEDENGVGQVYREEIDTYSQLGSSDMNYDYNLRTPWKYNVSLGYTVGSSLAIGAEFEYQDFSTLHFSTPDGYDLRYENSTADEMLKGVSTFRLGAEYKVIPQVAIRAGYNYSSAAFEKGAYKDLPANSIMTDTDFANSKAQSNYTLGLGYRGSNFYADLAYQYSTHKADFYAFNDEYLEAAKQNNKRNRLLLTLGFRF